MDEIIEVIGNEAALKLSKVYSGCTIYIPDLNAATDKAERNKSIRADRAAGFSIRELVQKYDLSNRRIFSICA